MAILEANGCTKPNGAEVEFHFGGFVLSRRRKQLWDRSGTVHIGGRAFELLLTMVENAGTLMTRQDLVDAVWPNTVVEENSLRVHMAR